jgi:hypothetical protein
MTESAPRSHPALLIRQVRIVSRERVRSVMISTAINERAEDVRERRRFLEYGQQGRPAILSPTVAGNAHNVAGIVPEG